MRTFAIKLEWEQYSWLKRRAKALKRSKGAVIRELISQQLKGKNGSLAQALADVRGCLKGSKGLSTRPLKGYGRRC